MNSNIRELALRAGAIKSQDQDGNEHLTLDGEQVITDFVRRILETNGNLTANAVVAYKIDNLVAVQKYLKQYYGFE